MQEYALAVSIFSKYLFIDALLTTIPRVVILVLTTTASPELCVPTYFWPSMLTLWSSPLPSDHSPALQPTPRVQLRSRIISSLISTSSAEQGPGEDWSPSECQRIYSLVEFVLCSVVLAVAAFQLWGAVMTRLYARKLYSQDALVLTGLDGNAYDDDWQGPNGNFDFPFRDDAMNNEQLIMEDQERILASGPWSCFGEYAGGFTSWLR